MIEDTVDAHARALIEQHLAVCNLHQEAIKENFERNKCEHRDIRSSVDNLQKEATSRWWWLMGVMLVGMGTIIMKLWVK